MAAEPRLARAAEAQSLARIAEAAYARYIPRLGQEPYAMRPDFARHIEAGNVWVIGDPAQAYLIAHADGGAWSIENLAVAPPSQGAGLGRALLAFAEREARARGFTSMRLYTNVAMTENQALYAALGWRETGRSQVGAMHRVHFEKPIPGRPMALKAAIFDVFGTVVDWRSGIAAVAGRTFQEKGIAADPLAFADAWRAEYQPSMERVRSGQRGYVSLDDLHYENLDRVLEAFALSDQFSEAERWALNAAWETLPPWPDVGEGLAVIRELMITAPCSNGSIALMTRLARHARLGWDCILGADVARAYKPQAQAYMGSAAALRLSPDEVLMVAAHNYDLEAAKAAGLATAFVPRPDEHGPGADDPTPMAAWDFIAADFGDLARQLRG